MWVSWPAFDLIKIFFTRPMGFHDICCKTDAKLGTNRATAQMGAAVTVRGFERRTAA